MMRSNPGIFLILRALFEGWLNAARQQQGRKEQDDDQPELYPDRGLPEILEG